MGLKGCCENESEGLLRMELKDCYDNGTEGLLREWG